MCRIIVTVLFVFEIISIIAAMKAATSRSFARRMMLALIFVTMAVMVMAADMYGMFV